MQILNQFPKNQLEKKKKKKMRKIVLIQICYDFSFFFGIVDQKMEQEIYQQLMANVNHHTKGKNVGRPHLGVTCLQNKSFDIEDLVNDKLDLKKYAGIFTR